MACVCKIFIMLYGQKCSQINPKHTIDQYNPDSNPQTILPSTSPPNMVSDSDGKVEELQRVLSTTKILLQTASWYT